MKCYLCSKKITFYHCEVYTSSLMLYSTYYINISNLATNNLLTFKKILRLYWTKPTDREFNWNRASNRGIVSADSRYRLVPETFTHPPSHKSRAGSGRIWESLEDELMSRSLVPQQASSVPRTCDPRAITYVYGHTVLV